MTPDQYCQDTAAKSGSSFYYSFLFLPPQRRQAITALYAFCRLIDDIVDEIPDADIARVKLNWWRDELDRLFDGKAQHPVSQALATSIENFNLPKEYFIEIIDGMEMDLEFDAYPSFKELTLYCYRVASIVGIMAAEIFGYQDRATLKYAHHLGTAFQLTNILRDVREDAERGRIYLPLDELERFDVSTDDLAGTVTTDNMKKLFTFQADRAKTFYEKAFDVLPDCDRYSQLSGLIMASIYRATLTEIEKDDYKIIEKRIRLSPLRKLWLAWTTSRTEKRRHKKAKKTADA